MVLGHRQDVRQHLGRMPLVGEPVPHRYPGPVGQFLYRGLGTSNAHRVLVEAFSKINAKFLPASAGTSEPARLARLSSAAVARTSRNCALSRSSSLSNDPG